MSLSNRESCMDVRPALLGRIIERKECGVIFVVSFIIGVARLFSLLKSAQRSQVWVLLLSSLAIVDVALQIDAVYDTKGRQESFRDSGFHWRRL